MKTKKSKTLKGEKRAKYIFTFLFIFMATNTFNSLTVFATAPAEITGGLGAILEIIEAICQGLGAIILVWGISEYGIAHSSQEGSAQAQSMKKIVGGLIVALAPSIAAAII